MLAQERQDAAAKDARHKLTVERLRRQLADLQVSSQLASSLCPSTLRTPLKRHCQAPAASSALHHLAVPARCPSALRVLLWSTA